MNVAQKCIDHFVIACSPCTEYGYQYTWLGGWGDCPKVQPLPFYMTGFERKGTPFIILLSIDKWYPFHIPSLELLDILELL